MMVKSEEEKMKIYDKFRLIIKAKKVPVIDNPIIEYIEDKNINHLHCEIYYGNNLIAKGVILDFYKEFENIVDFLGIKTTRISQFEWKGKLYTRNTYWGQKIFEIKHFINPPVDEEKRDKYIGEITDIFKYYIKSLIEEGINLSISYIPSSSKIPEEIAHNLSVISNIKLSPIIQKNSNRQSKSLTTIDFQNFDKYTIDLKDIDKTYTFLIIDDVVGTGATFCEVMYKFNEKINYFLAVVKDVKR